MDDKLPIPFRDDEQKWNDFSRGLISAVPVLGPIVEHYHFRGIENLRMKRVIKTISEIEQELKNIGADFEKLKNEGFTNLLEDTLPHISRTLNEEKQKAYKQLFISSFINIESQSCFDDAEIMAQLLNIMTNHEVELMYRLSLLKDEKDFNGWSATTNGIRNMYDDEGEEIQSGESKLYRLEYQYGVLEKLLGSLLEKRLIEYDNDEEIWSYDDYENSDKKKIKTKQFLAKNSFFTGFHISDFGQSFCCWCF